MENPLFLDHFPNGKKTRWIGRSLSYTWSIPTYTWNYMGYIIWIICHLLRTTSSYGSSDTDLASLRRFPLAPLGRAQPPRGSQSAPLARRGWSFAPQECPSETRKHAKKNMENIRSYTPSGEKCQSSNMFLWCFYIQPYLKWWSKLTTIPFPLSPSTRRRTMV